MKSCLVVDDSKVIRTVARQIVQGFHFDIIEAADGEEALAAREREMPDAILLDWNMPVMNGIDFLKNLRVAEGGATPVVVFCTTENNLDRVREAMEAGANEYIMKPFDAGIIEAKFAQVGLL